MAFIKRDVKDRVVQYPRRYQLVEVSAGVYDLVPVTGTVTEAGTAINRAYLQPIEDNLGGIFDGTLSVPKATDATNANNADKISNVSLSGLAESKVTSSTDLNTITKSGMYRIDGAPNTPPGCAYGQLLVIHGGGDTITQIYGDYSTGSLYTRSGNPSSVGGTGSWSAWVKLTPENHASTGSTYGLGTTANYGHVKVINDLNASSFANGEALSAYQGKKLNDTKQDKFNLIRTISMNTASPVRTIIPDNFDVYDELMFVIRGTISNSTSMSSAALSSFSLYDMASNGYKVDLHSHYFSRTNCFTNWDIKAISIFKHTGKWFESNFSPNRIKKAIYNKSLPSGNGDLLSYDSNLYFDFTPGYAGYTGTVYLDIYGRNL